MIKLLKSIILTLMVLVTCCAASKDNLIQRNIKPTELHLFRMMQDLKTTAVKLNQPYTTEQFALNQQETPENVLVEYLDDSIKLFENIIFDFNRGYLSRNPEIFFRFSNLCRHWDGKALFNLEPRHIRQFKKKVLKFDRFVKRYCLKRKDVLTTSEMQLFSRLTILNQRILDGLFVEDLLDIDISDKIIDTLFVRPYEFVCENPLLCSCVGIIALSVFGYFYGYPAYLKWRLRNANSNLTVNQPPVIQQFGQTCGIHAIWNAHCLHQAQGDRQRFEELANDRQAFDAFYNQAIQFSGPIGRNGLEGDQVRAVVQGMDNLSLQNFLLLDNPQTLQQQVQPVFLRTPHDIASLQAAFGANSPLLIEQLQFHNAITNFGMYQNVQHSNDVTCIANIGGHWIAYHFTRDANEQSGMRVIAADSSNRNVSNNLVINRLSEILQTGTYDVSANN